MCVCVCVCVCVWSSYQSEIHQQQKKYKEGTILFCPFGDTIFLGGVLHTACGILWETLVPQPGIELVPLEVEVHSFNH